LIHCGPGPFVLGVVSPREKKNRKKRLSINYQKKKKKELICPFIKFCGGEGKTHAHPYTYSVGSQKMKTVFQATQ
jgi:hypothetical protein